MRLCADLIEKICNYLPAVGIYNFRCCSNNIVNTNLILKSYINLWNNYNLSKRLKMIRYLSLIRKCDLIFLADTDANFKIFEIAYKYPKISDTLTIPLICNKINSLYLDINPINLNQVIQLTIFKKKTCCLDKLNISLDKNHSAYCTGSLSCLYAIDKYDFKKQKFKIILNID